MALTGVDGHRFRTVNAAVNSALGTPRRRWRDVGGDDSGCGIDLWLASGKDRVYANLDQGHLNCCDFVPREDA